MSDKELKAELERFRNENAALKKRGASLSGALEGQRKGSGLGLWHGALSRDLV
jgi:hypothetical protein